MKYPTNNYIILYDGECGFCNFWVQFIIKRDKKNQFSFASFQGDFGKKFLNERNLNSNHLTTLYLLEPQKAYWEKSSAVIKIAEILGGFYSLMKIFWIVPTAWRDSLYSIVAKNRRLIYSSNCYLPTEDEKKKFID